MQESSPVANWGREDDAFINSNGTLVAWYHVNEEDMQKFLDSLEPRADQFSKVIKVEAMEEQLDGLLQQMNRLKESGILVERNGSLKIGVNAVIWDRVASEAVFDLAWKFGTTTDSRQKAAMFYRIVSILGKANVPDAWSKITDAWNKWTAVEKIHQGLRSLARTIHDNSELVEISLRSDEAASRPTYGSRGY